MTKATRTVVVAVALLALGGTVRADEWDEGSDDDGGASTDNVIVHGVEQIHDLHSEAGVPDQDWYLVTARPFSSYQMVLDGFTGDTNLTTQRVQRLNATGGLVLQDALATDGGHVLSLDWQQGASSLVTLVRVQNGCPSCDNSSSYRIRFYDTTFLVPRFNNSGSQATVLLVQNAIERDCQVTYHFFSAAGTLLASSGPSTLAALAAGAADRPGDGGHVGLRAREPHLRLRRPLRKGRVGRALDRLHVRHGHGRAPGLSVADPNVEADELARIG